MVITFCFHREYPGGVEVNIGLLLNGGREVGKDVAEERQKTILILNLPEFLVVQYTHTKK